MKFIRHLNTKYDSLPNSTQFLVFMLIMMPGIILVSYPLFLYSIAFGYMYFGILLLVRVWWIEWS